MHVSVEYLTYFIVLNLHMPNIEEKNVCKQFCYWILGESEYH